jgi:hypothetical protein
VQLAAGVFSARLGRVVLLALCVAPGLALGVGSVRVDSCERDQESDAERRDDAAT